MEKTTLNHLWMNTKSILKGALAVAVGLSAVLSTWTLVVKSFAEMQHGVKDVKIHATSNTKSIVRLEEVNGNEHKEMNGRIVDLQRREAEYFASQRLLIESVHRIEDYIIQQGGEKDENE